jgi:predicted aldo/keto reductase-like oxidoreductase
MYTEGKRVGRLEYLQLTALRQYPSSASYCVECGKCESHCPQHIAIRAELKKASKELETPFYRFIRRLVHIFKLW